ncbi:MAG: triose-phosphate isomerase [Thaumarchaeota archaeon]|nr:MAG: triose-phosphate isomerase [Nitrososphaerota archaeon]TLX91621.1 MAG: triose-phosphate isomerase [Nitrososphaerota archaeon]
MITFNKPLIINLKNYSEISGDNSIRIVEDAKNARLMNHADIVVAPPPSSILALSKIAIPIVSQHVDDAAIGATTGFIVPEIVKSYGAVGSIINHSEHKIEYLQIKSLVKRLRDLEMVSIVCAADLDEVEKTSRLSPDFLAIEPPELIGKGVAVSKANPSIVRNSVKVVKRVSPAVKVICGAGIVDKYDVEKAIELGAEGILISSGIVKSSSWYDKILELASVLK